MHLDDALPPCKVIQQKRRQRQTAGAKLSARAKVGMQLAHHHPLIQQIAAYRHAIGRQNCALALRRDSRNRDIQGASAKIKHKHMLVAPAALRISQCRRGRLSQKLNMGQSSQLGRRTHARDRGVVVAAIRRVMHRPADHDLGNRSVGFFAHPVCNPPQHQRDQLFNSPPSAKDQRPGVRGVGQRQLDRQKQSARRVGVDLGKERLLHGSDIGKRQLGGADVNALVFNFTPNIALGVAVDGGTAQGN